MSRTSRSLGLWLLCLIGLGCPQPDPYFVLATTTSTHNSGLLDHLIPAFHAFSGIDVRPVVAGTGQALRIGANCDAEAVLVHHRASEESFVAQGHSSRRFDVMYNDFVVIGPTSDPAGVSGASDAAVALRTIAASSSPFVSRGDDSGTHKAELRLWSEAGTDPDASGLGWYRESGSGMGATLNTAAAMGAYTVSDRGTWISFKNRDGLAIHAQGDPRLFNPYGILPIDSERCRNEKTPHALAFVDWLVSEPGQAAIAEFRLAGEILFHPNARGAH